MRYATFGNASNAAMNRGANCSSVVGVTSTGPGKAVPGKVDSQRAISSILSTASPAYLEAHGTPRRVQDLARHQWIAFAQLPSPWSLPFRVGARTVQLRLHGRVSVSTTAAGRALALAGVGVVGAPGFTLQTDIGAGRLVRLLPNALLPTVALYAAWPGRMEPPAKTRALIELAKVRLRGRFG